MVISFKKYRARETLSNGTDLGPTCMFKVKEVPCVITNTENRSITSELLVEILKHMDQLDLFPRTDPNIKPILLLDGHGSCLELLLLKYINTDSHECVFCIEVPYLEPPTG